MFFLLYLYFMFFIVFLRDCVLSFEINADLQYSIFKTIFNLLTETFLLNFQHAQKKIVSTYYYYYCYYKRKTLKFHKSINF